MPQLRSQVGGKMRKRLDKAVAKAFQRDNVQAFSKLSRDGRRRAADRLRSAADRPARRLPGQRGARPPQGRRRAPSPRVQPHAAARAPDPAQPVPAGRLCAQGRRRRQRRDGRLGGAAARPGHARPAVPADQGGAAVGAGGVRRRERVRERRRARRRGPADHAGVERHLPRLAPHPGERLRPGARLLRAPAARLEGVGRGRGDGPAGAERLRAALLGDARPRPRPLGRPDRDRELPGPARRLRPGRARLQRGLRGAERARLRRAERRGRDGPRGAPTASSDATPRRRCSIAATTSPAAIYGTILVTSVVAAADGRTRSGGRSGSSR